MWGNQLPLALVTLLAATVAVRAQTSTSFHQTEHVFNAGGDPKAGALVSASYHVKLDAIGDPALGATMTSASFHADGGFVGVYRPPGEVRGISFPTKTTLTWTGDPSVGVYELYRDTLASVRTGSTGPCFLSSLTSATAADASTPGAGTGLFYLVTARNRLNEEGTKGTGAGGAPRPNPAPCP